MFTVNDLAKRFGLHPKSVRERLNGLSPLVEPHMERGRNNAILLTDSGLSIFDRLIQLEQDGHTMATAVQQMLNERSYQEETRGQPADIPGAASRHTDLLIDELRSRIKSLEEDKSYLQDQLNHAQSQIQAMLPAESEGRRRHSRWKYLKAVFTGGM